MTAASSSSIQNVNDFGCSILADASKPIGMSNAVSATMNKLMPSTPSFQLMPNVPSHEWSSTSCMPPLAGLVSNCVSRNSAMPSVARLVT